MAEAIERNATKAKGGAARTLSITNAYEPSEESVASRSARPSRPGEAGLAIKTGVRCTTASRPQGGRGPSSPKRQPTRDEPDDPAEARASRLPDAAILEAVRGDAWWLDIPSGW
jgi:hypothetical protein